MIRFWDKPTLKPYRVSKQMKKYFERLSLEILLIKTEIRLPLKQKN